MPDQKDYEQFLATHPAYKVSEERLIWAITPLIDEIIELEKINARLKSEINALKNTEEKDEKIDEYSIPGNYEICERLIRQAIDEKGININLVQLIMKKRKLKKIPKKEYPALANKLKKLIKDEGK